jgi:ParB family chromosome partitioning protein
MPGNMYELVSGERRLKASKMAGLCEIPAIIVDIDDNDSAIIALIENLQREDLTYLEVAEAYNNLIKDHGFTQEALALRLGKNQSTIANKIRLLKLSPLIKKILFDNELTERHARALLKLHDEQLQLKVLKIICERGLNVKKTEELVEKAIIKFSERYDKNSRPAKGMKDVRIFVNTIKQALDLVKRSGVRAKAAQVNKGNYYEFIIRIAK